MRAWHRRIIRPEDVLPPSRRTWRDRGWTLAGAIGSLGLWWVLTESGVAITKLVPGPVATVKTALALGMPLVTHFAATSLRVLVGFTVGTLLGTAAGFLLCYFRRAYLILDGVVESMRPVPPVALVPFFLLIFGFSEFGRFLLAGLGVTLVLLVAVIEAVRETPPHLVEALLTLGASKSRVYQSVVVPYTLSRLLGPTRVALALSVALVVVSEFMGVQHGLGYLINVAKVTFTLPTILLSAALLGILSGGLDVLLLMAFRALTLWMPRLDTNIPGGIK